MGLEKFSLFGEGVSGGTAATWTTIKRPEKVRGEDWELKGGRLMRWGVVGR